MDNDKKIIIDGDSVIEASNPEKVSFLKMPFNLFCNAIRISDFFAVFQKTFKLVDKRFYNLVKEEWRQYLVKDPDK